MTLYPASNPFPQILNLTGTGLNNGKVYYGVAGQDPITHPIVVYWDVGGTDVAAQPIPTSGGYLYRDGTPANVYVNDTYSIKVLDKNDVQIYYQADVYDPLFQIVTAITGPDGSSEVGFTAAPTGAVTRNVEVKLREVEISITDYGAEEGIDSTFAIDAAIAAAGDNPLILKVPGGDFQYNATITRDAVIIQGVGGRAEFNDKCSHPWNMAKPLLTFSNGASLFRACGLQNFHGSGAQIGTLGTAAADNCPQTILLDGGIADFEMYNTVLYGGLQTLSMMPSSTEPVTVCKSIGGVLRNDIVDSADACTIYGKRLSSDGGYLTDIKFIGTKMNGPTLGRLADVDGTAVGWTLSLIGIYGDVKPNHGIILRGGSTIVSWDSALDPGALGVPVVETDQARSDVARYINGYLNMAGNQFKWGDATTTTVPTDTTFFADTASLTRALLGAVFNIMAPNSLDESTAITAIFDGTNMNWEGGFPHIFDSSVKATGFRVAGTQVVGAQSASPIAAPTGGSTVDTECRASTTALINFFRGWGALP